MAGPWDDYATEPQAAAPVPVEDRAPWDDYAQPAAPQPTAVPNAAPELGGFSGYMARFNPGELYRGAARSVDNMGLAAARVLGIPAAQAFDTARSLVTDDAPNMAQNALSQHVLTPLQQRADSLAPAADASMADKVIHGVGGLGGNLLAMLATGGLSRAPAMAEAATTTLPRVAGEVAQAARAMALPAATDAINTGHDIEMQTGSLPQALGGAAAAGAANIGMGLLPAALPGNLAMRVATGAPVGAATGEITRHLRNLVMPSGMQQPFDPSSLAVDALTGGVLAGAMGRNPEARPSVVDRMASLQQDGTNPTAPAVLQDPAAQPPAAQPKAQQAAPVETPAPAPTTQKTPYAGSQDINPLLDRLGVQGEQRTKTMDLLRPVELNVEEARRGVVSNAERDRLASLIGLQGNDAAIFNRRIGQAWNTEETAAAISHVQGRLTDVLDLQQKITSGQATDIDRADFINTLGQLRSTFGDLAGARAEAGRALATYKKQAMDYRQAQAVLEAVGGVNGAEDAAAALGEAIRSGGLSNAARLVSQPEGKMQRLFGYYYRAALLSGVRTHAVNVLSNTLTLGNEMVERGIAAGIGGAKRLATGGKAGQTLFAEPLDLLIGMVRGSAKAGTAALDAFRTGESAVLGGQAKQDNATGLNNAPRKPGALNALAYGADKLASVPYRALGAEDAWFATLNYEAELRTLARQQAVAERKTGTMPQGVKLSQRIQEIMQDPSPQMIELAGEHARVQTFNQKAGTFAQAIMSAKAKAPWLNVIVPFVRTPANIVKFGLKRTPLSPFFKDVRADFAAGGARQERAAARMLWGSSIMIGAGALAQAGYITGAGPDDQKEKQALMATGWRPYSVRIDGVYHEYSRLDPFAQWLGLAADLATQDYQHKGAGDLAANVLGSLVSNTINKTYMQGLSNFVEFLQDPKRNGPWYLRQMGGTLAQPVTLLSNIASENDPSARETNSVLDAIKYRTPGLRDDLPEKLDAFGEPVPNRTYPGGPLSIAAPIAQSQQTVDPVRVEAGRLGWSPSEFQKSLTLSGKKLEISPEQHHELAQLAGQLTHQAAQRLMRSPGWAKLDDDQKRDALNAAATKARTAVRMAAIPLVTSGKRSALDRLKSSIQQSEARR